MYAVTDTQMAQLRTVLESVANSVWVCQRVLPNDVVAHAIFMGAFKHVDQDVQQLLQTLPCK